MKKYISKSILAICWLIISIPLMAAPPVDPDGSDDPLPPIDPTPIDNYLLVLMFVAIMIGTYWLYRKKWKTT